MVPVAISLYVKSNVFFTGRMGEKIRKAVAHSADNRLLAEEDLARRKTRGIPQQQPVLSVYARKAQGLSAFHGRLPCWLQT